MEKKSVEWYKKFLKYLDDKSCRELPEFKNQGFEEFEKQLYEEYQENVKVWEKECRLLDDDEESYQASLEESYRIGEELAKEDEESYLAYIEDCQRMS